LWRGNRVAVDVCVGADVASLAAESRGVREPRKTRRVAGQASFGVRASWTIKGPWFVRFGGFLLPPLSRNDYFVRRPDGSEELVFQRSPFSWVVGLSGGLEFGRPR
jgi:hypothetical protein